MGNPIQVVVNGLPGKMASKVVEHLLADSRFELLRFSLTGPKVASVYFMTGEKQVYLAPPDQHWHLMRSWSQDAKTGNKFIVVDFTHPNAVLDHADLYCKYGIPFVMGTTFSSEDGKILNEMIEQSTIPAVIAPNMAKPIVGFQAMMDFAASTYPGLFDGYRAEIVESHQQGKADTSGTARKMVEYLNRLGIRFNIEQIAKIRDPDRQRQLGVPEEHIAGHGWHTYKLTSPDGTVMLEFTHNVNGRDVYAEGALDAVAFLASKVKAGEKGVFSMLDVLKG